MSDQTTRQAVLDAVLANNAPEDIEFEIGNAVAENDDQIARYAIVSEYSPAYTGDSYSIDLTDDPDTRLRELGAGFPSHGYLAFCVVDLDTGQSRHVETVFVLGGPTTHPNHDFGHALQATA